MKTLPIPESSAPSPRSTWGHCWLLLGRGRNSTCPKESIPLCPLRPCQVTLPASDDFTTYLIINTQAQFPPYHSLFGPGNILGGKWPTTIVSMNFIMWTQAFLTTRRSCQTLCSQVIRCFSLSCATFLCSHLFTSYIPTWKWKKYVLWIKTTKILHKNCIVWFTTIYQFG